MKHFPLMIGLAGLSVLGACGDGTPFQNDDPVPVGTVSIADGVYTITQGDVEIVLNEDDAIIPQTGELAWGDDTVRARAFQSDNVQIIAGLPNDGAPFAAISGTIGAAPLGDATFTGRYTVIGPESIESGRLTLNYDLATGAVTNDGGALTVDAAATEINISGTVAFEGQSGDLEGNFFGENEVAGAFTGAEIGGIIYGAQDE